MKLLACSLAVFISLQIVSKTASAQDAKGSLHMQAFILDSFIEPSATTLNHAREVFSKYKRAVDPAALEILPNNRIEENVLLYIHSFTQGPHEILPLQESFTAKNFNILALSYSGHELNADGSRKQNYRDYYAADWKEDIQFALRLAKQYGKKVWIMGYSTGGLLALQQVKENSSRIKAMLLVAPALALAPTMSGSSCTGSFVVNTLDLSSEETQKILAGGCLIRTTISNVFERIPMMPKPTETNIVLESLNIPILVAYTERDTTVDNWRTEMIKDSASSNVEEYVFGEEDHATHGDILNEYSINQKMKNHPSLTLKMAIENFIQK